MKRDQEAPIISADSSSPKSDAKPLAMPEFRHASKCRQCQTRINQYLARKIEQKIEKSAAAFLNKMSNQKGFDQKDFFNFNLF